MYLFVDESIQGSVCTLGCVAIEEESLFKVEEAFLKFRINNRCWTEFKWSCITEAYSKKYMGLLELYLGFEGITVHTWTYKSPDVNEIKNYFNGDSGKPIHVHTYLLVQNVIRKVLNSQKENWFNIVIDESTKQGAIEAKKTREFLQSNPKINPKPNIYYCDVGDSKINGGLQVADLCAGIVCNMYSKKNTNRYFSDFVDLLTNLNGGTPPNFSALRMPKLNEYRIHHCKYIAPS